MNGVRRFRLFSVFCAILCFGIRCPAQESAAPAMPDRGAILALADQVTADAYPDADAVLLYDHTQIIYQDDGAYTQWNEACVKILTEEARRNYSTLSSYYTIPYQRGPEDCRIDLVEIIPPDGAVKLLDVEKQSRTMINPGSMGQNIYNPNDKIIQVNVAGLQIGDVLHYRMFDRIVLPRMTNTWCEWFVLEDSMPLLHKSLEVHAPLTRPLQSIALKAPVSNTVESAIITNSSEIVYRWDARGVPQFFPEPNMPSPHTVLQRLLISTAPDWETISRWYWRLSEPHYALTPAIHEKVQELILGTDDPQQQIKQIFRFVAQQIRYMGITVEATAPGYEPHDVKDTFEARHGVCRDKAALLVAMLRDAGFEAFPTLIHNGPKKDPEVPQPYFNHAIVAVRNAPGDYQLMDPTDESTAEILPAYLNDRSFLVATPDGEPLRTSPIIPAEENLMRIRTAARLTADGRLAASTELQFDGINDNAYRGYFASLKPQERTRYLEGILKRAVPDAVVDELVIRPDDMMDSSAPLSASIRYQAQNMLIRGREIAMLPVPRLGVSLGMANFILGKTGLSKRRYPLMTEIACGVDEQISIDLPDDLGAPLSMPDYTVPQTSCVTWSIACTCTGQSLVASNRFALNGTEYSPEQYLALKEMLKVIERDMRKKPVFSMSSGQAVEPGSRILDARVEYTVLDDHSWREVRSVKREILTYAGKKNNAELKLSYNPVWETVQLQHACVTAPDGTSTSIREEEINLMDAPWVGAAPRYPAGKTLVAAFPAVEIGSIIEFEVVRSCSNRPFFSVMEFFRLPDPINAKTVRLTVPESLTQAVFPQQTDGLTVSKEIDPANREYRYEWTVHQAPPVKEEDQLPPWYTFNPTLFFSTGQWTAYAGQVWTALTEAATGQAASEEKARELIVGASGAEEKIRLIRDFIATRIRPVGPAFHELPLSAITSADRTLSDGYGNSADTAVLFYAMLSAAGFQPSFILASQTPFIEELIRPFAHAPAIELFSSVLVRVVPEDDRVYYLNDGNQYSEPGASSFEDMICMVIPEGTFGKITPDKPTAEERQYTLRISTNGPVHITCEESIYGNRFGDENQRFSEMRPEDRRRYHQELIAGLSQAAVADGGLKTDFSGYPGKIEFSVNIPDYAIPAGPYLYFALPETLGRLFRLRESTRTNPLYLSAPRREHLRTRIEMPAEYTVESAPEKLERGSIAGAPVSVGMLSDVVSSDRQAALIIDCRMDTEPAIIDASNYEELLRIDGRLESCQNDTVVLKETSAPE